MADGYAALRTGAAAVWLQRDFVTASGPDAGVFLQGQLSQDVLGLRQDHSAWSWVLQPTGKVDALVRITRRADDAFVLDTDRRWGEALVARLGRFRLRSKLDLEVADWACLGLRGPEVRRLAASLGITVGGDLAAGPLAIDASWPGLPGVDLVAPTVEVPPGVALASGEDYEALRIEAGIPRMGAELDERTIPAETGLVPLTVDFNKGCYTGQELVARIDSRGSRVARHLRVLRIDGPAAAGATLHHGGQLYQGVQLYQGGREVGVLTSVARVPAGAAAVSSGGSAEGWVGLGYVRRAVEPPATVLIGDGGPEARVEALPEAQ
ncbi:MAG: YgfZ/GcvT domain-containing protein [Acidimicrobiales bacterium]